MHFLYTKNLNRDLWRYRYSVFHTTPVFFLFTRKSREHPSGDSLRCRIIVLVWIAAIFLPQCLSTCHGCRTVCLDTLQWEIHHRVGSFFSNYHNVACGGLSANMQLFETRVLPGRLSNQNRSAITTVRDVLFCCPPFAIIAIKKGCIPAHLLYSESE